MTNINRDKCLVRGQGLLEDDFGKLDRINCRKVLLEDLTLDQDAFIILNVGTQDMRKGIDLFVLSAIQYFSDNPKDTNAHFVWYGHKPKYDDTAWSFAFSLIERSKYKDRIRLLPSTSGIERIFMGADLFLLTARADPFPCVIHEALACGLPVIAFQNGGGAPELIGDDCGAIVEMANPAAVSRAISIYRENPELRILQSKTAINKIHDNWLYQDYFSDIWQIMSQVSPMPAAPALTSNNSTPDNLIIMPETGNELPVIRSLADFCTEQFSHAVFISGFTELDDNNRFSALTDHVKSYRIIHPNYDDNNADLVLSKLIEKILFKPRPKRVTLIDIANYIDPKQLQILDLPKRLVINDERVTVDIVLNLIDVFDDILCTDANIVKEITALIPKAKPFLRYIDKL